MNMYTAIFRAFVPLIYGIYEGFELILGFIFLKPIDIVADNPFVKRITKYISGTFVGKIFNKYYKIGSDNVLLELDKRALKYKFDHRLDAGQRLLVSGRRFNYAKMVAPKEQFPTHYMDVPDDLKRDIISDGRTLSNREFSTCPAVRMAGKSVTEDLVVQSWRNAASAQMKITVGVILLGLFLTVSSTGIALKDIQLWVKTSNPVVVTVQNKIDSQTLANSYEDIWSDEQAVKLTSKIRVSDNSQAYETWIGSIFSGLTKGILIFGLFFLATLGVAYSVGRLMFIAYLRDRVHHAADTAVQSLRFGEREALQRWKERYAIREAEYQNYCRTIEFINEVDRSPTIKICTSLGIFDAKGHLLSCPKGTVIVMSINDMATHTIVYGATGEGKSRVIVPLAKQLLELRKEGWPIAIYGTDSKCEIYLELIKVCESLDIPKSEILVIGTNSTDFKVDILDGLAPFDMADLMSSVAKQSGAGDDGSSFWPQLGSDLILQIATVLVAFEKTETGTKWMINNNMRAYSLINILRVAQSDEAIEDVLKVVLDALSNKEEQYIYIQHLDNIGLRSACDFLVNQFISMVDATKIGIIINVRTALRSFSFKPDIADGFGTGYSENIISATELSGDKIKLINISQDVHGSAGRMVCIALKTLFFKQAQAKQSLDPIFESERKKWWYSGIKNTTAESKKYFINIFLADEYQTLITASEGDSLSDSSVWNVLRGAGVYGFCVSQSISAYRLAIGDGATDNFVSNFQSMMCLRVRNEETQNFFKYQIGQTQRFSVSEWDHCEGTVAARYEYGVSTENVQANWSEEMSGTNLFRNLISSIFNDITFSGYQNLYSEDRRFISNSDRSLQDEQASAWRQEDRRLGAFQHGSSKEDVFVPSELMHLGKGCGVVLISRGKSTVVDMVQFG